MGVILVFTDGTSASSFQGERPAKRSDLPITITFPQTLLAVCELFYRAELASG
jgi:hypothetical protein